MQLIIFAVIITLACFVQAVAGFGLPMIATPVLVAIFGIRATVPLMAIVILELQIFMIIRYHTALNIRTVWRYSAAAIVGIVFGMAVEASRWRRLEGLVLVTPGTLGFRMFADQREAGRVVIELHVGPGGGGVAVAALRAHGVTVDVVRLVAGKTLGRRIAVLAVRLVAFPAFGFAVLAEQREVGEVVCDARRPGNGRRDRDDRGLGGRRRRCAARVVVRPESPGGVIPTLRGRGTRSRLPRRRAPTSRSAARRNLSRRPSAGPVSARVRRSRYSL